MTRAAWPRGFDPERLTVHASLNRTVVRPLPDPLARFEGRSGGDLLSRNALHELAQATLQVEVPAAGVADALCDALQEGTSSRPRAITVIDELGDRLAALVATLRHPATADESQGGRRRFLLAWQGVRHVVLGGGLARDGLGRRAAARAATVLAAAGTPVEVRAAPLAPWLPLIGAARSRPDPPAPLSPSSPPAPSPLGGRHLVLDGGHTALKRAVAETTGDSVTCLRVLPSIRRPATAGDLASLIVDAVRDGCRQGGVPAGAQVVMSLAAYVRDGRELLDSATAYKALAEHMTAMEAELGRPLHLLHDGTAAWRGLGSDRRSAVVMLGTWLGVGLGPHRSSLLRLAPTFAVGRQPS